MDRQVTRKSNYEGMLSSLAEQITTTRETYNTALANSDQGSSFNRHREQAGRQAGRQTGIIQRLLSCGGANHSDSFSRIEYSFFGSFLLHLKFIMLFFSLKTVRYRRRRRRRRQASRQAGRLKNDFLPTAL